MKRIINPRHYFLTMQVLFLCMTFSLIQAQENSKSEEDLVRAAIEDYVLALYEADPGRIERSVDTTLRKIGYAKREDTYVDNLTMSYDQLHQLSARWNVNGDNANDESPRAIEIYEVNDKTASAKLTAQWGIDFFHLSKVDGQWKIMNVMWQTLPFKD